LISVVQHPDTTTRGALDRQTIPQLVPRITGAERTFSACGSASDCRHTEAWTNRCEEGFRLRSETTSGALEGDRSNSGCPIRITSPDLHRSHSDTPGGAKTIIVEPCSNQPISSP